MDGDLDDLIRSIGDHASGDGAHRSEAQGAGFFRQAGRRGSTASETPATT
jgi:hypothetical protein